MEKTVLGSEFLKIAFNYFQKIKGTTFPAIVYHSVFKCLLRRGIYIFNLRR